MPRRRNAAKQLPSDRAIFNRYGYVLFDLKLNPDVSNPEL
jgi:hypothetical protein